MSSRTAYTATWLILAATGIGSIIAYPYLPPVIATHWNAAGQVNGTTGAFWGAFMLPLVMLALILVFTAIPHIDPLRANIEQFRKQYNGFLALFMLVLAAIQAAILAWNLGALFNISAVILPAVGILMFYVGVMLPQTKRNWFMGIRTPWTISSDLVWHKTHELGGTLFKIFGVVIVLAVFAPPQYAIWIIVAPLAVIVVGLFAYSYVLFREQEV